jgi:hypothetical protein
MEFELEVALQVEFKLEGALQVEFTIFYLGRTGLFYLGCTEL